VDNKSLYSDASSHLSDMIVKFQVHKQLKQLLQQDLQNKVTTAKSQKGINTYFFGDNRQGKCGIGNDEPYVMRP
jgi:hypothetical protein